MCAARGEVIEEVLCLGWLEGKKLALSPCIGSIGDTPHYKTTTQCTHSHRTYLKERETTTTTTTTTKVCRKMIQQCFKKSFSPKQLQCCKENFFCSLAAMYD